MTPTDGSGPWRWSPWRVVVSFGFLSLFVDVVSDGGQSVAGPLLGQLGATALVVGIIAGAGEAIAQGFRLVTGPWSDRSRRYWDFTLVGYVLTVICVPLLAVTPFLGAAGLILATVLILGDRFGKAVRSPAKTVLLADAAGAVGRGRGFAVHKSLDMSGSLLGPLFVAGVIALTGVLWPAYAVLAIPGAVAILLLLLIRRRVPNLRIYSHTSRAKATDQIETTANIETRANIQTDAAETEQARVRLPRTFFPFAAVAFTTNAGLVTFGLISFHLTDTGMLSLPSVPVLYAAAMAVAAGAALTSGYLFDRLGTNVLLPMPILVAFIPGLTLSNQLGAVIAGTLIWGAATGVQESTVKALVADLVPYARRGTAYGVFAAFEGAGALVGGVLAGALYSEVPALIAVIAALQALGLALLIVTVRAQRRVDGHQADAS
jgi:MFS family permease